MDGCGATDAMRRDYFFSGAEAGQPACPEQGAAPGRRRPLLRRGWLGAGQAPCVRGQSISQRLN